MVMQWQCPAVATQRDPPSHKRHDRVFVDFSGFAKPEERPCYCHLLATVLLHLTYNQSQRLLCLKNFQSFSICTIHLRQYHATLNSHSFPHSCSLLRVLENRRLLFSLSYNSQMSFNNQSPLPRGFQELYIHDGKVGLLTTLTTLNLQKGNCLEKWTVRS